MTAAMSRRRGISVVDIVVDSPLWVDVPRARQIVRRAIDTAAADRPLAGEVEISVLLTDDAAIRKLNSTWRGLDIPTNVLSFPAAKVPKRCADNRSPAETPPLALGDIVIAFETTAREARAEGKLFAHHLAHLAVHGFLHLLGYDHESEEAAHDMERREADILARLDMPDPYATQDAGV